MSIKVEKRNVIEHKREAEIIRKMIELRDKGYSYRKIAEILKTMKVPTKTAKGVCMDTRPRVSANWNKSVEATLNFLVDKETPYQVITIYGATGTGKTELLRKVLNEAEVCKVYDSVYVYDWDDGLGLDYDEYKRISLFDYESSKEDEILFVIEDASDLTVKSHSELLVSIQKQLLNNDKSRILATSQRSILNLFCDVQTEVLHL